MRISSQMIYDSIKLELARKNQDLLKANRIIATGKRINRLSDDPASLVQSLGIRSSLSNLSQLDKNITRGKTWLGVGETVLNDIKDLIADARALAHDLNDGSSLSTADRAFAAEQVEGILTQILDLANSGVDGQYLFSGTKTDTRPFEWNDPLTRTDVRYLGNNEDFAITIGKDATVEIGHDGEKVFFDDFLVVNDKNNKLDFLEDPSPVAGDESLLSATIPSGKYTPDQLATVIEQAMEGTSANGVDYVVSFDPVSRQFSIADDGTLNELRLLWETGPNAGQSIGPELGFGGSGDSTGDVSYAGEPDVQWSIFKTLIEFRDYVLANDVEGVNRSAARLNTHFEHMLGTISERIIAKQVRVDMREKLINALDSRYAEIKSKLEDADITEAIMDLKSKEFAYQAALESAARIMEMSLVDFL